MTNATIRLWVFVAILVGAAPDSNAETYKLAVGGSWNSADNWDPANIPNAVDANATFVNAASGSIPAQTANRTITLDGTKTVGSILFNNDAANTFTNSITTGTGGPLVFDATDSGPATITVPAAVGTGNNTISVATRLDDSLVATVDNITATSAAGALNLTATITGSGGFTKFGDGLATFGTGAKTYSGPTVLSGGRMRISFAARPSATSSFTINAGAQLVLITTGNYNLGAGQVNLNGFGPTSGPFAAFPGAIRPDSGLAFGITNDVVLQSDSAVHATSTDSPSLIAGTLTFSGVISGPGRLQSGVRPGLITREGFVVVTNDNTYTGGTLIEQGTLTVSSSVMASADLGSGSVMVDGAIDAGDDAFDTFGKLVIEAGITSAIADTAYLNLTGGGVAGIADRGYLNLGTGVIETVGGLMLGGVIQPAGTYGATGSGAVNIDDEYFAGLGIVNVVPFGVPGDYNGNGTVDAADYVLWRNGGPLSNDFTPGVQASDYDFWRARFGATTHPGSGSGLGPAGVPEPSPVTLFAFLGTMVLGMRGSRLA